MRNNQLTSLPRSLDNAVNLKAKRNLLHDLISSSDYALILQVLDVSSNKLQFLNCNLSPLVYLKELGNTPYAQIAQEAALLTCLLVSSIPDCKQNMLSTLPTGWGNLSNLTRVDLSHNQVLLTHTLS